MRADLISLKDGETFFWQNYPLATPDAFKTVNGAVFYTLDRLMQPDSREESAGAVRYSLTSDRVAAKLFVLHITPQVASMRLHPSMPSSQAERIDWYEHDGPIAIAQFAPIFRRCHDQIISLLHEAALAGETIPQPPDKSDLEFVLVWQTIHRPNMKDKDLAELVGVEHQSIRNARLRLGMPKREKSK